MVIRGHQNCHKISSELFKTKMNESNKKFSDFVSEGFNSGWKHIDASLIDSDQTLEADVVIVGSGAGGANTAEILAQAGLEVIILEEGPLKTSKDFRMKEDEAYSMCDEYLVFEIS